MKRSPLFAFIVLASLVLAACASNTIEGNMSKPVADFEFTTQNDKPLSLKDLEGDWWLANFMYTNCGMVCPTTTPHMARVQKEMDDSGLDAQFVSFTVDPIRDTPETLRNFTNDYSINTKNWNFLTGYDFKEIRELSNNSFQAILESGGPGDHEFAHSTLFFLVDPTGEIVKNYDGMSVDQMDVIIEDLKTVLQ